MKKQRSFAKYIVTKKAQTAIENGHPWVYENEIKAVDANGCKIENGMLADVVSLGGSYLGTGILSEKSKIRIRLISRNANDVFDSDFFERRIRYALDYRKTVLNGDIGSCRLIFGEADHFPGLTVDKFEDVLVTQTMSMGMERLKSVIFPLLCKVLKEDGHRIRGIYERNDVKLRELEGLEQNKGWFFAEGNRDTSVLITENDVKYEVDIENGQKTGFFLDQRFNRLEVSRLAKGKNVLDCFTHTGSFALNAAMGGAGSVCAVDISETAINQAERNAYLNNLKDKIEFKAADIFELLPRIESEGKGRYDFIILDPPAFTKSRKTVQNASRGYKEINYRAMKILPRGGYLATCSCSHFMPHELFVKMLKSAARDAAVELRQIEARQQSPDHPIVWSIPETDYLKFYIFQVV